jgi:mutator protein MutT
VDELQHNSLTSVYKNNTVITIINKHIMLESNYPSSVWKHCPYCGSKDLHWEKGTHKMVCGRCNGTFYINAASAVVAIIRNDKGELLFTRRKNNPHAGALDFPGGFVDLGERVEDAVRREVREELNLHVSEIQFFMSMPNRYLFGGIVYFTLDMVFFCNCNSLSGLKADDDVSEYIFMPVNEVNIDEVGLESIKLVVQHLKDIEIQNV